VSKSEADRRFPPPRPPPPSLLNYKGGLALSPVECQDRKNALSRKGTEPCRPRLGLLRIAYNQRKAPRPYPPSHGTTKMPQIESSQATPGALLHRESRPLGGAALPRLAPTLKVVASGSESPRTVVAKLRPPRAETYRVMSVSEVTRLVEGQPRGVR